MDEQNINAMFVKLLNEWFKSMQEQYGQWGSQGRCAKQLGISQGHLSSLLSERKKASEESRLDIIKKLNMPYEIIYGIKDPGVSEKQASYTPSNVIELKHINIIKRFKNKELATTINERLVELEKVNPVALNQVLGYIDCKIREEASPARKNERRKSEQPDKVPITGDRRNLGG